MIPVGGDTDRLRRAGHKVEPQLLNDVGPFEPELVERVRPATRVHREVAARELHRCIRHERLAVERDVVAEGGG